MASTYPEKLIKNLNDEIDTLKKENERLKSRVEFYLRQAERVRYPRDAIDA